MQISLANTSQAGLIETFFSDNLLGDNDAIYSAELTCPLGIHAAVRRKQMIVATVEGEIIAACRFYPKKTQSKISLYQFAVRSDYRGKGLLKKMFAVLPDDPIISICPIHSNFNNYYSKTGWTLHNQNGEFKIWTILK